MAQIASIMSESNKSWLENIKSVIIVNSNDEVILSLNNSDYGHIKDDEGISKFIIAMDQFAREIGGYKLKMVELGSDKIYSLRDESTEFLFIVVSHNRSKTRQISKKLKRIREIFLSHCIERNKLDISEKEEIEMNFYSALEQNGAISPRLDEFLVSL